MPPFTFGRSGGEGDYGLILGLNKVTEAGDHFCLEFLDVPPAALIREATPILGVITRFPKCQSSVSQMSPQ